MRCAGAILLIAYVTYLSDQATSSNKVDELSIRNLNKLHGSKNTNCKYIKCPSKVDRACVQVKNKNGYGNKTIYIAVINKCEIDYIRCHEGLKATRVPLEKCLHKRNTTKRRLERSPHIVTRTKNNQVTRQARKLSAFNKSPYHNKYSSLYFGPKRKAVYMQTKPVNKNDDDEAVEENFNENIKADHNDERDIKEVEDGEWDETIVDRGEVKEAQDFNTETEERLDGVVNDDRGSIDKEVILFKIHTSNDSAYSQLKIDEDDKIVSLKSNEDENVNKENLNENENLTKNINTNETYDEDRSENNMAVSNEDKLIDDNGDDSDNRDRTIIITIDGKDKIGENYDQEVEAQDNERDDNEDQEPPQYYIDDNNSDPQTDNNYVETQKNIVDKIESTNSKNDSEKNEGPKDSPNIEGSENPVSEKGTHTEYNEYNEIINVDIKLKPNKDDGNVLNAPDKNSDIEESNIGKEKLGTTEKQLTESDTSTEEDKKDDKINDAIKPGDDGKKAKKQSEDNYDDVDKGQYSKDCPTVCPARDVMLCARCKEGVYRTFMSVCHLRMFNCKHPEEKLELVSRKPCILSAPFLNGMKTKGTVKEAGDEDKVLRYIQCREKGDPDDPKCNFGRRVRKRRINV